MSTTTIRIPEDLKSRVARAADRAGTSAHNFILEAITEKTDALEQRQSFYAQAEARYAKVLETGLAVTSEDMRGYLDARISGRSASRPVPKPIAK